jgi:hypothetical protein
MALEKLKILVIEKDKEITALFNPNQITIQKTVNWRNVPTVGSDVTDSQFSHGNPATLTMDLFFDTYETGKDVQKEHTKEIFALTTVEEHGDIHRPPICKLMWGEWEIFKGILQSLNQRFTLFLADGTPVRATLGCTFKEWRSREEDARRRSTESVDVAKTHTVKLGDTLSSIAGVEYNDPTLWRPIAEANGIDNPRILAPGQTLAIPPIRSQGRTLR